MCGIVGYIGREQAVPFLLEGLHALEYRGYDSAGVAVLTEGGMAVVKKKGRVKVLDDCLKERPLEGHLGIGHTRWATHGEPSDGNAHPQVAMDGRLAVVHNGIIENYLELKQWLTSHGARFVSETDTEVVAHLVAYYYQGDLLQAVMHALRRLRGAYALAVACEDAPDRIVCCRSESPLVIGLGEGGNYVASDVSALIRRTRRVCYLEEKSIAVVKANGVEFYDGEGERYQPEVREVEWNVEAAEKGGYAHFMLKEIHEQPRAVRDTVQTRIHDGRICLKGLDDETMRRVERIVICACGTAYHAGMVAKHYLERLARMPVETDIASEYRYRQPIIHPNDLCIVVSQSGETADTIAALRTFHAGGGKVLGVVNVVGSTVERESDIVVHTWAGPEIGVASTKAYTTQLSALLMIAMEFGRVRGTLSPEAYAALVKGLLCLPEKVGQALLAEPAIQRLSGEQFNQRDVFFMGRGLDYPATLESALKLKEISYIHCEALAAGELKHGTIALIEEGVPVVVVATQPALLEKLVSNILEVKARGAYVICFASQSCAEVQKVADETVLLPDAGDYLSPMVSIIPAQMFAYYCAVLRGLDPDKPRNLAKSVTVE